MMTQKGLINAALKNQGNITRYKLCQLAGISEPRMANWYRRGTIMDNETAVKIGVLAGLPIDYVLVSLAAQRDEGKASFPHWATLAESLKPQKDT